MAREVGTLTPEAVVIKPKTVLEQVIGVLKPRTEGKNPDVFLVGVGDPMDWAEMFSSPCQPTFDIKELNKFTKGLLEQLKAGIKDQDVHFYNKKGAETLFSKGGIIFPSIFLDKREPEGGKIKRKHITILIYPSPQIAELALAARTQCHRLPKGFDNKIIWEITGKQIKDLDTVTLKPSNAPFDL